MTILLLGGLYFGLRFAFGIFTPFNFWTAQQDIKNGKVQIADIGELPLNHRQKQSLANIYGFDFYYFGCKISTDIINGTKYYNNAMVDHLENKFGADWWLKFQNQLDSIDNATSDLQKQVTKTLDKSIEAIKNVFEDYIKYQESTDSQDDRDLMTNSLKSLDKVTDLDELEILINVWMYYDPTDFPSRNLVFDILEKSHPESIKAVKTRITNKKEWETDETAPYSELKDLLKNLMNEKKND